MWTEQVRSMIGTGILETLYMTVVSTVFGYLFGLPMGILLCITDKEGLKPNKVVNCNLRFHTRHLRLL